MPNESNDLEREVYRARAFAEQKYIYFLLAASGAGIFFALNQTKEAILEWSQIPLGIGIFCWGMSFLFGCYHLNSASAAMFINLELLKVQLGKHPNSGGDPQRMAVGNEVLREKIEDESNKGNRFAKWQFRFLISGALFYICWHILEMYLRSTLPLS